MRSENPYPLFERLPADTRRLPGLILAGNHQFVPSQLLYSLLSFLLLKGKAPKMGWWNGSDGTRLLIAPGTWISFLFFSLPIVFIIFFFLLFLSFVLYWQILMLLKAVGACYLYSILNQVNFRLLLFFKNLLGFLVLRYFHLLCFSRLCLI